MAEKISVPTNSGDSVVFHGTFIKKINNFYFEFIEPIKHKGIVRWVLDMDLKIDELDIVSHWDDSCDEDLMNPGHRLVITGFYTK